MLALFILFMSIPCSTETKKNGMEKNRKKEKSFAENLAKWVIYCSIKDIAE